MTVATPNPETRMLTATCLHCGDVIYKRPYGRWEHGGMPGWRQCVDKRGWS